MHNKKSERARKKAKKKKNFDRWVKNLFDTKCVNHIDKTLKTREGKKIEKNRAQKIILCVSVSDKISANRNQIQISLAPYKILQHCQSVATKQKKTTRNANSSKYARQNDTHTHIKALTSSKRRVNKSALLQTKPNRNNPALFVHMPYMTRH